MFYHLATVLLAVLFFAQGKYVRRVTPKLPEPEGLRKGISVQGPLKRVLLQVPLKGPPLEGPSSVCRRRAGAC